MAVNIPGAIAVVVFYVIILVSGIIAGRKTSRGQTNESILVADRSLSPWVSILTITATGVGGAFINGCAEAAASSGLLYSQTIIGFSLCLLPAGFFYAPKMRKEKYITMFDPFQLKYGRKVGALLFLPQFFGDLFWSAATLSALGATISIILDIDSTIAIIVSAVVAIFYTFCGGLYAVAYTDVFQLIIIGAGLIIAFPFCLTHESVSLSNPSRNHSIWGEVPTHTIGSYIDVWLLCLGGGIPWQALYQRVLACKTARIAQISTMVSCFVTIFLATPAVIIGVAGGAANWNLTSYDGEVPLPAERYAFILPLSLSYLTPLPVGIVGIGAMAAAAMSSADSCFLSSSTVMAKNIFQDIIKPNASQREIIWCLRISILIFGSLTAVVAITVKTIYGLFVLCGDLMYVILLPQLTAVLWMKASNAYGCVSGFFVAFILRILCGEPILGLPAFIKLPLYDAISGQQHFPYRSLIMAIGTLTLVVVSMVTNYLFFNEILPWEYDLLQIYKQKTIHLADYEKREKGNNGKGNNSIVLDTMNKDAAKPIIVNSDDDINDAHFKL